MEKEKSFFTLLIVTNLLLATVVASNFFTYSFLENPELKLPPVKRVVGRPPPEKPNILPTPTEKLEKKIKKEFVVQKSKTYEFTWDKSTNEAVLKKEGRELNKFNLPEMPLAAWIYKPNNALAIITIDKYGNEGSPHSLYISSGSKLVKVYTGSTYKIGELPTLSTKLYGYWNLTAKSESTDIEFSPDGKYVLGDVSGYESTSGLIISVEKAEDTEYKYGPILGMFWSPDSGCFLKVFGTGMYGPSFYINKKSSQGFTRIELKISENISDFELPENGIFWQREKRCSGIINLKTEPKEKSGFYEFNPEKKSLSKFLGNPNLAEYQKSARVDQENIFFTLWLEE